MRRNDWKDKQFSTIEDAFAYLKAHPKVDELRSNGEMSCADWREALLESAAFATQFLYTTRLKAVIDVDMPQRPDQVEQREGLIFPVWEYVRPG